MGLPPGKFTGLTCFPQHQLLHRSSRGGKPPPVTSGSLRASGEPPGTALFLAVREDHHLAACWLAYSQDCSPHTQEPSAEEVG